MNANSPSSLCGCEPVVDEDGYTVPDWWDTTDCRIHPICCEGIHPVTGQGCQLEPGHSGTHACTAIWEAAS